MVQQGSIHEAALGVVKGYTEDTFAPHEAITRAEFAAICARFDTGTSDGESSFTDNSGHWAEKRNPALQRSWGGYRATRTDVSARMRRSHGRRR